MSKRRRHLEGLLDDDRATGHAARWDVPVIELRQVGLTYPGQSPVEAVRSADLTIERGDFVAIVGPSGSGKSSLLNILGLLDRATTGRYLLDGMDVSELNEARLTALRGAKIGFVFQAFHLLPYRTVLENVEVATIYHPGRLPLRQRPATRTARREQAMSLLRSVGLDTKMFALPLTLSGGERQRVAIARALSGTPSLLLCDEPTGNLDSHTAEGVLTLLEQLNADGITVVIITHDHSVSARARRIVEISDGYLRELTRA